MTFAAHMIKANASSGYNVGLVGVLLFLLAIICFIIPALNGYGLHIAIIGILLVLFGAISGSGSGGNWKLLEFVSVLAEAIKDMKAEATIILQQFSQRLIG